MFPNDDICNIRAAKNAARRIFEKYQLPSQNQQSNQGLGSNQVSNLIKNAYEAINIQYNPSNQDVFSFMQVFGVQQNGKIQLDKIQQLAVKYLCGEDQLLKNIDLIERTETKNQNKEKRKTQKQGIKSQQNPTKGKKNDKKQIVLDQKLIYQQKEQIQNKTQQIYVKNKGFLSPKVQIQRQYYFKQNSANKNINSQMNSNQKSKKLRYFQVLNQANQIFNQNKNIIKNGITVDEARKVIEKSYQLIGRTRYKATQQDVKIWIKLCDTKRNGIIEWASYQNFIKRLMERENIKEFQFN